MLTLTFLNCMDVVIYVVRDTKESLKETYEQILSQIKNLKPNANLKVRDCQKIENTLNRNIFVFKSLNDMTFDPTTGGGLGLTDWATAKYILVFVDEANAINEEMWIRFKDSVRGNNDPQIAYFLTSNPFSAENWFIADVLMHLPENQHLLETRGWQSKVVTKETTISVQGETYTMSYQDFYCRLNWRCMFSILKKNAKALNFILEWEGRKKTDWNGYKVSSLGMSGNVDGMIYNNALQHLRTPTERYYHPTKGDNLLVGIDYGWSDKKDGSPTACILGMWNSVKRTFEILAELKLSNYLHKQTREETINQVISWINDYQTRYAMKVNCYVDNASEGEFYQLWNSQAFRRGLAYKIKFWPAVKEDRANRIEIVNFMIESGLLRYNPLECPNLHQSYSNAYYVYQKGQNLGVAKRFPNISHQWSHFIDAVDYALGNKIAYVATYCGALRKDKIENEKV